MKKEAFEIHVWTYLSYPFGYKYPKCLGFPDGSVVKNLPAMQETQA